MPFQITFKTKERVKAVEKIDTDLECELLKEIAQFEGNTIIEGYLCLDLDYMHYEAFKLIQIGSIDISDIMYDLPNKYKCNKKYSCRHYRSASKQICIAELIDYAYDVKIGKRIDNMLLKCNYLYREFCYFNNKKLLDDLYYASYLIIVAMYLIEYIDHFIKNNPEYNLDRLIREVHNHIPFGYHMYIDDANWYNNRGIKQYKYTDYDLAIMENFSDYIDWYGFSTMGMIVIKKLYYLNKPSWMCLVQ